MTEEINKAIKAVNGKGCREVSVLSMEGRARAFYKAEMAKHPGACYRPTNGQEPRISWLIAAFAEAEAADARRKSVEEFVRTVIQRFAGDDEAVSVIDTMQAVAKGMQTMATTEIDLKYLDIA